MAIKRAAFFAWWCAATIFLSAFLLFQVQPVISKMILPWFGGGPAVWTACMLFFQVLLLGGYAYTHLLCRLPNRSWQVAVHIALLVLAGLTLPITPDPLWKPEDGTRPTWNILILLAVNVGLPYFILASTGPLVQAWFSQVLPGRSPYRLYALSNVGSLGALLTYPFLFEPQFTTSAQGGIWSLMFGVFALMCGVLAVITYRAASAVEAEGAEVGDSESAHEISGREPTADRRIAWVLLPALASMMLLAITNHVCQDIAVVPFFWVVPLSLYLLSFIICFDNEAWYRRRIFGAACAISILVLCGAMLETDIDNLLEKYSIDFSISDHMGDLVVEASVYLVTLFLICMVCHGELVRCKPPAKWLTSFYLMVAAGGALGGIFVALICPQVFSTFIEVGIGLVAAFMLATGVLWDDLWETWLLRKLWRKCILFCVGFALLLIVVRAQFESLNSDAVMTVRNFYGTLSIEEQEKDDSYNHNRRLLNGRILHGCQFLSPERCREPTTYYNSESGIGIALEQYLGDGSLRVAVVGLGTGTLATYGKPGEYFCFYEINPNVELIATEYFSFLRDSQAQVNIILGDARISMERQEPQDYDVIALDAFSGDAIPAHLLTKEAFAEYFRHLDENGVIAVHISNRHLDLTPVVGGIAEHFGVQAIKIEWNDDDYVGEAASDWVLLSRNDVFLNDSVVATVAEELDYTPIPLWTDQYSNLFQILD